MNLPITIATNTLTGAHQSQQVYWMAQLAHNLYSSSSLYIKFIYFFKTSAFI